MFIIPFRQIAIMSLETVTPVSNSNNCISYCDLYLLTTTITLISAVGHGHTLPGLVIQPAVAGASLLPPNYHWPLAAVLDDNLS